MTERVEQRICIKFCQKLGYTFSQTVDMIHKANGNDSMSNGQIRRWFKRFEDGRVSVNTDLPSSRLFSRTSRTAKNIERVQVAINENSRLTVQELKDDLGITCDSVSRILTEDLEMSRVCAKLVSRVLNQNQKDFRVEVVKEILEFIRKDPELIERVITGDEIWIYGVAQKAQSMTREESRSKKANRSNMKTILTVFFDHQGIVHHEYAPQDHTINTQHYLNVFKRLREAMKKKRPHLWKSGNWLLHHDDTSYSSDLIQDFFIKHGIVQLRQPPYSPDVAPCDFWLFSKLKNQLKRKRFKDVEDLKLNVTRTLLAIPKNDFQDCFRKWVDRWKKVIVSKGDYFESNTVDITPDL